MQIRFCHFESVRHVQNLTLGKVNTRLCTGVTRDDMVVQEAHQVTHPSLRIAARGTSARHVVWGKEQAFSQLPRNFPTRIHASTRVEFTTIKFDQSGTMCAAI